MKHPREKNIGVFNSDVAILGSYAYSDKQRYSARIATGKQTQELVLLIRKYFTRNIQILDIGCGDGTFTLDLHRQLQPMAITGFDPAGEAITAARNKAAKLKTKSVKFKTGNIYQTQTLFAKGQFDVGVIRGVLHHLYEPQKAISSIAKVLNNVIVLEPNGYNPILKIIEKASVYHVAHEERSYWPHDINRWFIRHGYRVTAQKFCSIVPYFCPDWMAKLLNLMQPYLENIPYINRFYCGTNLVLYQK